MKSEIKDGLFTSTQASALLEMSVQTLREWQRKKYLPLPDTGGWQRYRLEDIFAIFSMEWLLQSGLTHEKASSIAKLAYPIYEGIVRDTKAGILAKEQTFRLLVSTGPNTETEFEPIKNVAELAKKLEAQTERYTVQFLIDFRDLFEDMNFAIEYHTFSDGARMFWKSESGLGQ